MNGWIVTDPRIFFGVGAVLVAYVLYMMIRKRKGERSPLTGREIEL